jgi:hypothetical protein
MYKGGNIGVKKYFATIMKLCFACYGIMLFLGMPFITVSAAIYEPAKAPKIKSFTASTAKVKEGETVVLQWQVVNAARIRITGLEKEDEEQVVLPLSGSMEVLPTATTTYLLEAVGKNNEVVSKTLTVEVVPEKEDDFLVLEPDIHDWGSEYIINFDINNTSDQTVEDWTLTLKQSEFDITIIWGAEMTKSGDKILIRPLHYNGLIKPGSKVSFGFEANGSPVPNYYYHFDTKTVQK